MANILAKALKPDVYSKHVAPTLSSKAAGLKNPTTTASSGTSSTTGSSSSPWTPNVGDGLSFSGGSSTRSSPTYHAPVVNLGQSIDPETADRGYADPYAWRYKEYPSGQPEYIPTSDDYSDFQQRLDIAKGMATLGYDVDWTGEEFTYTKGAQPQTSEYVTSEYGTVQDSVPYVYESDWLMARQQQASPQYQYGYQEYQPQYQQHYQGGYHGYNGYYEPTRSRYYSGYGQRYNGSYTGYRRQYGNRRRYYANRYNSRKRSW